MKNDTTYEDLFLKAYNETDLDVQEGLFDALYDRIGNRELYNAFLGFMYTRVEGLQAAKDWILY